MKIPLSWVSEFVTIPGDVTIEQIENAFVRVGFEVEEVIHTGEDVTGPLVVGKVESIAAVEGQKKPIRYVGLDCGEGEVRYVICGAQNFEVGDFVVVALPGAILPHDFAIAARQTYGHTSNGMICSAKELSLSDDHAGIINLPKNAAKPGDDAIELLGIRDVIFDIAINPDRGYALSIRGLARELAASLGLEYRDPAMGVNTQQYAINNSGVPAQIADTSAASHIYVRTIEGVDQNAASPLWMSRRIEKCGMRSISLIVDITNYVMLELGQPLHAFDAEKITGTLRVVRAEKYPTLETLDGVERKLFAEDLIIADDSSALALAGVMGGAKSEVTSSTTKIALEGVRFDPISIAKNSRRHKLSTEASRRLERAVDPMLAEIATARAITLMIELSGVRYVGTSTDGSPVFPVPFTFNGGDIARILGFDISIETVVEKLSLVGAEVTANGEILTATPPSWRPDLLTLPDFVEEVARNIGFDAIPSRLPVGKGGAGLSAAQKRKREYANYLSSNGFNEVYCFPFVNEKLLAGMGFTGARAAAYKIANPMSEENPLFRTHILPGLILAAARNINRGTHDVAVFEIGNIARGVFDKAPTPILPTSARPSHDDLAKIYDSVPAQQQMLAAVVAGSVNRSGWWGKADPYIWSDAIGQVREMLELAGAEYEIHASDLAPWHPGRCAEFRVNNIPVAHAGELHPRVCREYGLPVGSTAFGILINAFDYQEPTRVRPVWAMPASTQDISLFVNSDVAASAVERALRDGAGELLESITLFDRFVKKGEEDKTSLAFTLTFRAPDRTLTAEEVSGYRQAAGEAAAAACGAVIRTE